MSQLLERFATEFGLVIPPYAAAGLFILLLYIIQAEIRFGAKARANAGGAADRGSTIAVSLAAAVPTLGILFSIKASSPPWLRGSHAMPGMPAIAWVGVALGVLGLALRMWAVLTLRERYTRTLLIHENHAVERSGPYRLVRHPGYLGSLLCLIGVALSSGNAIVSVASIVTLLCGYAYRIRVEDQMLVGSFGKPYESYRREVRALVPFVW